MGQPGGEYVHLSVIGGREDGWTERIGGSRIERSDAATRVKCTLPSLQYLLSAACRQRQAESHGSADGCG